MHVDSDEDVGGFQGAAASVAVWVWCLMDGHSSPTHPDSPMVPPPLWVMNKLIIIVR